MNEELTLDDEMISCHCTATTTDRTGRKERPICTREKLYNLLNRLITKLQITGQKKITKEGKDNNITPQPFR